MRGVCGCVQKLHLCVPRVRNIVQREPKNQHGCHQPFMQCVLGPKLRFWDTMDTEIVAFEARTRQHEGCTSSVGGVVGIFGGDDHRTGDVNT